MRQEICSDPGRIAVMPAGMVQGCNRILRTSPVVLILLATLLFGSCSNLRYLDEDQSLYTGSEIKIDSEERIRNKTEIERRVNDVIRPLPNRKLLIWRPWLWLYNIGDAMRFKALGNWIQSELGRPPVLMEDVDPERIVNLMENRLFNMGHFEASVDYELIEKRKRTSVAYHINLKAPYRIRNISLPGGISRAAADIALSMEESNLQSGQIYRLEMLGEERERIDRYLKERGYFYFFPDYLLFRVDSTAGNREVDLYLTIKPTTPPNALEIFFIRNIHVVTGGISGVAEEPDPGDAEDLGEGVFITGEKLLRPNSLLRAIFLEKDRLYQQSDHTITINHLMGMRVFRFVNIRYERVQDDGNYLDARITLTPLEKKAISTELRGVSKSNNFAGPGFTASFSNRNLLGGAENFIINLDGAFETLLGGGGIHTYEAGISSEVSLPHLPIPFKIITIRPHFTPRTRMSLSLNYLNRTDAFSLYSLRSDFGYEWNPYISTKLRFSPFVFNVFNLGTISPEFEEFFSRDVLLRRGLFEQFLLGGEFYYLYNSQLTGNGNHNWYISFNMDWSGNLARLALHHLGLGTPDDQGTYRILNQGFSQFTRVDLDIRYYLRTGPGRRVATRLVAGIGLPYGNSTTLPHTKLFIIGGSNSIRAFHPRTLGPGTYSGPDIERTTFNLLQSGEIKLAMSLEYRIDFSNVIKGAVFADAGNVWNRREQEDVPGGKLRSPDFLRQVALGTGTGIRLDFNFFLLRLDLAFPLADPRTLDERESYFQSVRFLDPAWRRSNLILNLAIGYPF